jgi:preprotein translocase subunit Sec61beta
MARDNKISMPSSMGGLVRYFDEEKTKFIIKPGYVVFFAVIITSLIILLKVLYPGG